MFLVPKLNFDILVPNGIRKQPHQNATSYGVSWRGGRYFLMNIPMGRVQKLKSTKYGLQPKILKLNIDSSSHNLTTRGVEI